MDDDCAAFGIVQESKTNRDDEFFVVWPENETALRVFLALETQWRYSGGLEGDRARGIDYAALPATLSLMGVKKRDRAALFNDLRLMESAALGEINDALAAS